MMQQLGTRYVRYFNACHDRTGTLWEGRFRSCLIDSDDYLLTCQRYIELNPVRAGLAPSPGGYTWSSYHCNAEGRIDPLVKPHPVYTGLAINPLVRQQVYAGLVAAGLSDDQLDQLRRYTHQGRAWGSPGFQSSVEEALGHHAAVRHRGRQRK
jgi:putative transposase